MFAKSMRAAEESSARYSTNDCPLQSSPIAIELIPAIGCSFITTAYTQRTAGCVCANCFLDFETRIKADLLGSTQNHLDASTQDALHVSRLKLLYLGPSSGVMFTSCLVLGFCVSSFIYRHQKDDQYQALVFTSAIVGSVISGKIAGAGLNLILLGFLPWSLCTAMFLSICGHALLRMVDTHDCEETMAVDDKTALLP